MSDINLRQVIDPAIQVINFILEKKGLGRSNLLKQTSVIFDGQNLQVYMPDYTEYVDKGRRAGKMPPISAIVDWIKRNNIKVPNNYTQEQFAYAVAGKIARKGTKGYFFIEQIAQSLQDLVFDYLNKKIDEQINKL